MNESVAVYLELFDVEERIEFWEQYSACVLEIGVYIKNESPVLWEAISTGCAIEVLTGLGL